MKLSPYHHPSLETAINQGDVRSGRNVTLPPSFIGNSHQSGWYQIRKECHPTAILHWKQPSIRVMSGQEGMSPYHHPSLETAINQGDIRSGRNVTLPPSFIGNSHQSGWCQVRKECHPTTILHWKQPSIRVMSGQEGMSPYHHPSLETAINQGDIRSGRNVTLPPSFIGNSHQSGWYQVRKECHPTTILHWKQPSIRVISGQEGMSPYHHPSLETAINQGDIRSGRNVTLPPSFIGNSHQSGWCQVRKECHPTTILHWKQPSIRVISGQEGMSPYHHPSLETAINQGDVRSGRNVTLPPSFIGNSHQSGWCQVRKECHTTTIIHWKQPSIRVISGQEGMSPYHHPSLETAINQGNVTLPPSFIGNSHQSVWCQVSKECHPTTILHWKQPSIRVISGQEGMSPYHHPSLETAINQGDVRSGRNVTLPPSFIGNSHQSGWCQVRKECHTTTILHWKQPSIRVISGQEGMSPYHHPSLETAINQGNVTLPPSFIGNSHQSVWCQVRKECHPTTILHWKQPSIRVISGQEGMSPYHHPSLETAINQGDVRSGRNVTLPPSFIGNSHQSGWCQVRKECHTTTILHWKQPSIRVISGQEGMSPYHHPSLETAINQGNDTLPPSFIGNSHQSVWCQVRKECHPTTILHWKQPSIRVISGQEGMSPYHHPSLETAINQGNVTLPPSFIGNSHQSG